MAMTEDNWLAVIACSTIGGTISVLAGLGFLAHDRAEDLRTERQVTERVRIEACTTIEDAEVRALCITGRGQK